MRVLITSSSSKMSPLIVHMPRWGLAFTGGARQRITPTDTVLTRIPAFPKIGTAIDIYITPVASLLSTLSQYNSSSSVVEDGNDEAIHGGISAFIDIGLLSHNGRAG